MRKSYKKFFLYSGIAFLILAGSLTIAYFQGANHHIEYKELESLHFANGTKFDPLHLDNRKKVIYFWATWCSTCSSNLPFLRTNIQFLKKFSDTAFVSIEEGESKAELNKYIHEKNIEFPVLFGNIGLLKKWSITYYPTTLFINEKSEVKFVDTGVLNPISFWVRLLFL